MKTIEYPQHIIDICLKLRYEFEDSSKTLPFTHSIKFKRYMWKNFLSKKFQDGQINKYINDICLEEFLNPKDYTKEKIEERKRKRLLK